MKMYSPSQTMLFDICPFKWYLSRKQGVKLAGVSRKEPAAIFGKSFGNTFSVYYAQEQTHSVETSVEFGLNEFDTGMLTLGELSDELLPTVAKYRVSLQKAIEKWRAADPIPKGWTITGIEEKAQETDTSYLDLAGTDHNGLPFVWDNKCKMYCPNNRILYEVQEYADSWQLYHYAWSYGQKIGQSVSTYYIYFVIGAPTVKAELFPFAVDEDHLVTWHNSAVQKWARMEEAEQYLEMMQAQHGQYPPIELLTKGIPQAAVHRDRWGRCEMYEPCRVGKGQPYNSPLVVFP